VVADAGDGSDSFVIGALHVPATLYGGPGEDRLHGGGQGVDTLDGGPGDDHLYVGGIGDTAIGGPGIDTASYLTGAAMSISLDGVANDGAAGAGLNFAADIEDVEPLIVYFDDPGPTALSAGPPVALVGSAQNNRLSTAGGDDHLDGRDGEDTLTSAGGDDTIEARDGYADRVDCGPGNDIAYVDQHDQVYGSCENTITTTFVGGADDRPPVIAFSPMAARLPGSRGTTLRVDVTDDRGVRSVRFMDDDRQICLDTSSPFSCVYTPRGDDVGRNTLTAIATDIAEQTSSAVRAVTVGRIAPRGVTLRVRDGVARGVLRLPATVTRAKGCTGTVSVSGRRAAVRRDCTYRVRVGSGRRYVASFRGNRVLAPARSAVRPGSR
jgi:Ca2+-binding RTX toxin-like protein